MAEPIKQKSGKYRYRIRIKHPITNVWIERSTTQKSKKACIEWEREIRSDILCGMNPDSVKIIPFFDLWFETYKRGTVGPDHKNKINSTRNTILEFFGEDQLINNLTKIKYQQWINYLGFDKRQAKSTVLDKHKIFKSVIIEAVETGYLRYNPTRNVTIVGRDTTGEVKKALTLSEWKNLLNVLLATEEDSASKMICLTMMYTGMRFQEATGLLYSDINFKQDSISITKAFDYKREKESTRTKTPGSVRVIDMPIGLRDILKEYMFSSKNSKIITLDKSKSNDFLFTNELGVPITNAACNKFLTKKCKEAEIDRITTHAFRRSKTDLLVLAGNDMIYTQKQLGHVDASTTLKYYSQLNEDIRDKNKKIQEEFLKENQI
ncbi:site-specific integrase [Vagococcus fluvialis]|uniref:tyrosine-type recombinase/integrase n=1 Tax=Vagococcus fluvialis TaxID=2738 RepID=UPI001A8EBD0C|nr:site-specific integrase [Vagococcus fluvialis]MBO0427580.1 site-specific integrase [Vagococcus fluvialis]